MSTARASTSRGYRAAIGCAEDAILKALCRYHYLSASQVCRLLYKSGSLTYVQAKLKALSEAVYVQRLFLPRASRFGSAPSVYCLSSRGRAYLQQIGISIRGRRPSEESRHSYLFLSHTLEANSVLIGAELLTKEMENVQLAAVEHERSLRRHPVYVEVDGDRVGVIPDGWLDFRVNEHEQQCIALELDRGTEEQKAWRRKFAALLAYSRGPYQERFGTASLTIAVATTSGDKRMWELLRWSEAQLQESVGEPDLFRFSSLSPLADPREFFLGPYWYRPFDRSAHPLLEGAR